MESQPEEAITVPLQMANFVERAKTERDKFTLYIRTQSIEQARDAIEALERQFKKQFNKKPPVSVRPIRYVKDTRDDSTCVVVTYDAEKRGGKFHSDQKKIKKALKNADIFRHGSDIEQLFSDLERFRKGKVKSQTITAAFSQPAQILQATTQYEDIEFILYVADKKDANILLHNIQKECVREFGKQPPIEGDYIEKIDARSFLINYMGRGRDLASDREKLQKAFKQAGIANATPDNMSEAFAELEQKRQAESQWQAREQERLAQLERERQERSERLKQAGPTVTDFVEELEKRRKNTKGFHGR